MERFNPQQEYRTSHCREYIADKYRDVPHLCEEYVQYEEIFNSFLLQVTAERGTRLSSNRMRYVMKHCWAGMNASALRRLDWNPKRVHLDLLREVLMRCYYQTEEMQCCIRNDPIIRYNENFLTQLDGNHALKFVDLDHSDKYVGSYRSKLCLNYDNNYLLPSAGDQSDVHKLLEALMKRRMNWKNFLHALSYSETAVLNLIHPTYQGLYGIQKVWLDAVERAATATCDGRLLLTERDRLRYIREANDRYKDDLDALLENVHADRNLNVVYIFVKAFLLNRSDATDFNGWLLSLLPFNIFESKFASTGNFMSRHSTAVDVYEIMGLKKNFMPTMQMCRGDSIMSKFYDQWFLNNIMRFASNGTLQFRNGFVVGRYVLQYVDLLYNDADVVTRTPFTGNVAKAGFSPFFHVNYVCRMEEIVGYNTGFFGPVRNGTYVTVNIPVVEESSALLRQLALPIAPPPIPLPPPPPLMNFHTLPPPPTANTVEVVSPPVEDISSDDEEIVVDDDGKETFKRRRSCRSSVEGEEESSSAPLDLSRSKRLKTSSSTTTEDENNTGGEDAAGSSGEGCSKNGEEEQRQRLSTPPVEEIVSTDAAAPPPTEAASADAPLLPTASIFQYAPRPTTTTTTALPVIRNVVPTESAGSSTSPALNVLETRYTLFFKSCREIQDTMNWDLMRKSVTVMMRHKENHDLRSEQYRDLFVNSMCTSMQLALHECVLLNENGCQTLGDVPLDYYLDNPALFLQLDYPRLKMETAARLHSIMFDNKHKLATFKCWSGRYVNEQHFRRT